MVIPEYSSGKHRDRWVIIHSYVQMSVVILGQTCLNSSSLAIASFL